MVHKDREMSQWRRLIRILNQEKKVYQSSLITRLELAPGQLTRYFTVLNDCGFIDGNYLSLYDAYPPQPTFILKWYIPEDFGFAEAMDWASLGRKIPWFINPEGGLTAEEAA